MEIATSIMDELQLLQICNQWDDVNLSTPELRRQHLEILLCQKVKNGEDISQCLQLLEYLINQPTEYQLSNIFLQKVKYKFYLELFQQLGLIGMAVLLALTCCFATFKLATFSTSNNCLSTLSSEKLNPIDSISRKIKRLDQLP